MSLIPFCLLNVTTWKLEIAYVTCTIFLLESTGDILKHMDIHIHILHMDTYICKNSLSGMFKNQCSLLLPGKAQ